MDPMMQKYTLNIADIELSLRSDVPPSTVEKIRELLDRKMREIYLMSRCPKAEAALLCAMEFCSDRMSVQERIAELEERCDKYATVLETIRERNSEQATELDRLRNENAVLRSLLTQGGEAPAVSPDPISPTEFFARVAGAQNDVEEEPEAIPEEEPVAEAPVKTRSRVGSMFEQLSFGDVD